MADHKMVQQMFRQAERAKENPEQLRDIVEAACAALTLHAEIEEQHFYPVMRETGKDTDMIAEAYVEHASAKQLIAQLEGGDPGDEEYAATFKVLGEYVKHHIKEEESQVFPQARRAKGDFEPLLEALVARDEAVMAEAGEESEGEQAGGSARGRGAQSQSTRTGGTRGRQGRGRSGGADAASEGQGADGAGAGEAGSEMEQPRRGRRGAGQDTADAETGARGREDESEDQEGRGSRQGGR